MLSPALRYLVVVVLGLSLDLSVALMLAMGGAPTSLASAAGLVFGATGNFFMHRYWTFQTPERQPMVWQILSYAASVAMILPIRLAVLQLLHYLPVAIGNSLALVLATGVSFLINFLVLKRLVFRRRPKLD